MEQFSNSAKENEFLFDLLHWESILVLIALIEYVIGLK